LVSGREWSECADGPVETGLHTIAAFLEIVQGTFGEAHVQSIWEPIDLLAADVAPFEYHLGSVVVISIAYVRSTPCRRREMDVSLPLPDCTHSS